MHKSLVKIELSDWFYKLWFYNWVFFFFFIIYCQQWKKRLKKEPQVLSSILTNYLTQYNAFLHTKIAEKYTIFCLYSNASVHCALVCPHNCTRWQSQTRMLFSPPIRLKHEWHLWKPQILEYNRIRNETHHMYANIST